MEHKYEQVKCMISDRARQDIPQPFMLPEQILNQYFTQD